MRDNTKLQTGHFSFKLFSLIIDGGGDGGAWFSAGVFPYTHSYIYKYCLDAWEFKLYCIVWIVIIVNNVEPCVCMHRTNAVDIWRQRVTENGGGGRKYTDTRTHILNRVFCAKALRTLPWNTKKGSHISMIFTYTFHQHTFSSSYYPIFVHLYEWNDTLSHCVQSRLFLSRPRSHTHNLEHALYAYRLAFNEKNTTKKQQQQ